MYIFTFLLYIFYFSSFHNVYNIYKFNYEIHINNFQCNKNDSFI